MSASAVREGDRGRRGGIDGLLTLKCERTSTVDEKVRTADWPNALLERWSDQATRSPARVQKPLAADFIAHAGAPAATCVRLPVPALQRAWRQHGRQGNGLNGRQRAENPGYTSERHDLGRDATDLLRRHSARSLEHRWRVDYSPLALFSEGGVPGCLHGIAGWVGRILVEPSPAEFNQLCHARFDRVDQFGEK